jgi:GGDEF domain-containing protein
MTSRPMTSSGVIRSTPTTHPKTDWMPMPASQRRKDLADLATAESLFTVGVPLIHNGATLGALVIGRMKAGEPAYSALECEALSLIAAQTALSLTNARLLGEVSELAMRDGLTGLYNRRHFEASLEEMLRRHARRRGVQIPVAAIMFDLDHFGRLNKQHGHQTGDAVLRTFAGILQERFRASDLVARYGGEEFVAIGRRFDARRRNQGRRRSPTIARSDEAPCP